MGYRSMQFKAPELLKILPLIVQLSKATPLCHGGTFPPPVSHSQPTHAYIPEGVCWQS
jgi:hypothetical protein